MNFNDVQWNMNLTAFSWKLFGSSCRMALGLLACLYPGKEQDYCVLPVQN